MGGEMDGGGKASWLKSVCFARHLMPKMSPFRLRPHPSSVRPVHFHGILRSEPPTPAPVLPKTYCFLPQHWPSPRTSKDLSDHLLTCTLSFPKNDPVNRCFSVLVRCIFSLKRTSSNSVTPLLVVFSDLESRLAIIRGVTLNNARCFPFLYWSFCRPPLYSDKVCFYFSWFAVSPAGKSQRDPLKSHYESTMSARARTWRVSQTIPRPFLRALINIVIVDTHRLHYILGLNHHTVPQKQLN